MIFIKPEFTFKIGDPITINNEDCVLINYTEDTYENRTFRAWAAKTDEVGDYYSVVEILETRQ